MTKRAAAAKWWRGRCAATYFAVRDFLGRDERGMSLVEYALTLALISIACIAAISAVNAGLANAFAKVRSQLP